MLRLVAALADRHQLPLSGDRIVNAERKIRTINQVFYMMHDVTVAVPAASLAHLTLAVVHRVHSRAKVAPFLPVVEFILVAGSNQVFQFLEFSFVHGNKKTRADCVTQSALAVKALALFNVHRVLSFASTAKINDVLALGVRLDLRHAFVLLARRTCDPSVRCAYYTTFFR